VLDEVLVTDASLLDVDFEVAVVATNLAVVALVAESLALSEARAPKVATLETPMSAVRRRARRKARSRRAIDAAAAGDTGEAGALVAMTISVTKLPLREVGLPWAPAASSAHRPAIGRLQPATSDC
jgi:hypothetical protein